MVPLNRLLTSFLEKGRYAPILHLELSRVLSVCEGAHHVCAHVPITAKAKEILRRAEKRLPPSIPPGGRPPSPVRALSWRWGAEGEALTSKGGLGPWPWRSSGHSHPQKTRRRYCPAERVPRGPSWPWRTRSRRTAK